MRVAGTRWGDDDGGDEGGLFGWSIVGHVWICGSGKEYCCSQKVWASVKCILADKQDFRRVHASSKSGECKAWR